MSDMAEEIQTLKKQVKKLKGTSGDVDLAAQPQLESSTIEKECRESYPVAEAVYGRGNYFSFSFWQS